MTRLSYLPILFLAAVQGVAASAVEQTTLSDPQTSGKWDWNDCGTPDHIVSVQSIQISPDPPVPGKNLTVTVQGTSKADVVAGAMADVTVKLGLIKLLQKRFDICEEADKAEAEIRCPVEKGEHTVVQTVELPKEIPKAAFNIHVDAFTDDDEDLMCLNLKIDFRGRPFFGF